MDGVAYVLRHYYTCADCGIASHVPGGESGDVDEHHCTVCQDVTSREFYYTYTAGIRPDRVKPTDTVLTWNEVLERGAA